jgi:hypothetical protein
VTGVDVTALADGIDGRIRALPAPSAEAVRRVRRDDSRQLGGAPADQVLALAFALLDRQRWVAYEFIAEHPGGLDALDAGQVEALGAGLVKALSWALRELVRWDPAAVKGFVDEHAAELHPRVRREVAAKLATGRKHPARPLPAD